MVWDWRHQWWQMCWAALFINCTWHYTVRTERSGTVFCYNNSSELPRQMVWPALNREMCLDTSLMHHFFTLWASVQQWITGQQLFPVGSVVVSPSTLITIFKMLLCSHSVNEKMRYSTYCVFIVPQIHTTCQSKEHTVEFMEISVDLHDKIVSRHSLGWEWKLLLEL